jgi:transposase
MYYTGIDLHSNMMVFDTIDEQGLSVKQAKISNNIYHVLDYFNAISKEFSGHRVVVESTLNWYWLVDLLNDHGINTRLAHAARLSAIKNSKVKTDKIDAKTLAQLLRLNFIPDAYVMERETRAIRDVMRNRLKLTQQRITCLNNLHSILFKYNQHYSEENLSKLLKDKNFFKHIEVPVICVLQLKVYMRQLKELDLSIKELESSVKKALIKIERKDLALVLGIPGVGLILGMSILLEIGPIERFANEKKFFSYARLVPGASNSNLSSRHKNSKQGNTYLKVALSEAAVSAIRNYSEIKKLYQKLTRKHGKKIARAIIAKEIGRGIYYVLLKQEEYRSFKGIAIEKKVKYI